MDLQVGKWGNSLALRIPAELARQLGIEEGSVVDARVTIDGALTLKPNAWSRRAFAAELREAQQALPMGESVVEQLRREARY